ncbi:MAG: agmatinase family protein, partial [Candidatus Eisenbacteria bacterium]|nr:agmatinase family protein [Candidatus Eisenbacteria bacterium]
DAIRTASQQVDLYDHETGRPYERGIAMLETSEEVREWNREARAAADRVFAIAEELGDWPEPDHAEAAPLIARVNELGSRLNDWVEQSAAHWRAQRKIVAVVGGDHSVPLGAIRATARAHPGIGILHLDAHADLRDAYMGFTYSHASIFHNVMEEPAVAKLVQVGLRDLSNAEARTITESDGRIVAYFDSDLQNRLLGGEPWGAIVDEIVGMLPRTVYLSFDIDGLDPALCPNTGTPVPGGLGFSQVLRLLRAVAESGRKIVGLDLCEVSPGPGGDSEWDANVGARLLYKMIGFTLLTHAH